MDYLTISKSGEGVFKDRGSKFIGVARPVDSEDDIKKVLEELRKQYYDARHHCYAYVLGADRSVYRANDDGEPNHSAGDPILGQINSKELTNVLVVVIRYFGGTKLGVSGLINAYKSAAEEAISNSEKVRITLKHDFELNYSYEATNEVMRLISDFAVEITDQQFETDCSLKGKIRIDRYEEFVGRVELLNNLGTEVELGYSTER